MKNLRYLLFGMLFLTPCAASFAQIRSLAESLQGVWYKDGRNEIRYSIWAKTADNTLINRDFSLVCGDTILNSTASLTYDETQARLTLKRSDATLEYALTNFDEDGMTWENPVANPKTLGWRFSTGGYAFFTEDGHETIFRREAGTRMHLNFFASLGANVNYYAHPVSPNRFLAANVARAEARSSARKGAEMSLAAELSFPSTRFCLQTEFGLAYREVGIIANFTPAGLGNVQANRDGFYRNTNYYFALGPGLNLGRHKGFYAGALFYTDLIQQKYFSGISRNTANDAALSDPGNDIDSENGIMLMLRKQLKSFGPITPHVYVRYTQGLSQTRLRAFSAGVSISLEKH